MTPQEALEGIRVMIESQGPDTANRHYGRNQFVYLMECCDTLKRAITHAPEPEGIVDLLNEAATFSIEDGEDTDELVSAWLTADDISNRLRGRLQQLNYWWNTVAS